MAEGSTPGAIGVPDFERAQLQHLALTEALKSCGVAVTTLNPDVQFPSASRIADMAVVTEKLAVLSNFSEDDSRQGEQQAAATILAGSRFLKFLSAPGLLDAGDVLRIGNKFFIGLSDRTNDEGAAQLAYHLKEFGYDATVITLDDTAGGLRLGSAAVCLGDDRIMIREEIAMNYAFLEYEKITIPRAHKAAAAAVMINGTLILPYGFPELRSELRLMDIPLIEVNVSEFEKTGGTLSSLILSLPEGEKSSLTLSPDMWRKKVA
jgi:dimethylargininase